jgi:polysaccharide biosynthesis protein PslH
MIKVLYTTPVLQYPAICGPHISVENAIKALSIVSDLHVISRVSKNKIGGDKAETFFKKYCKNFLYSPSAAYKSGNRYINKIQRIRDEVFEKDANYIIDYYDKNFMDVIWCDRGLEASFELICSIKRKRPDIKVVNDTCAVYSKFILRGVEFEKDASRKREIVKRGQKKEKEEDILINLADITTAVSEVDARHFRSIAEQPKRIKLFSNVIDVDLYRNVKFNAPIVGKPYVYFAGWFGPRSPTDHGARWFIDNVLEIVKKQVPEIIFCIAGRGSKETMQDISDENISIIGELPSLLPYLCNADIVVIPLWFESGTRFKILEAGAAGKPVVSTTLGAEGIEIIDGENILIADDPEGFSNSIIRLLNEPEFANRIGKNLNSLIKEKYCVNVLAQEAVEIFRLLKIPITKE